MRDVHPQVRAVLAGPEGPEVAAFFDFDGTLIDGYSVKAIYQDRLRNFDLNPLELLQLGLAAGANQLDEDAFTDLAAQAARLWKGRDEQDLLQLGERLTRQKLGESLFLEAWDVVQAHHRMGHTVVVATAASLFQVAPLAADLGIDHILCSKFATVDGMLTGELDGPPLWGRRKAEAVQDFAEEHELDLADCHAYGNGDEDIAFLSTVGHPHPVNPQPELARHAKDQGWEVVRFEGRGRPDPLQVARSIATFGTVAAAGTIGVALGVLNRDRRQGVDLASGLLGDLALGVAGVELEVHGSEHLWSHRPAVFIFNHQSGIDVPVMAKLIREKFTGVAKAELGRTPVFGQLFRWADVAFVDRGNTKQAKEALAPVVERLREGTSIVIAPEGTRSPTPRLGRFRKGAFHLAMQAGVPIVPVVIRNAGEVAWRNSPVVREGTIGVVVHPPIDVSDWTVEELDDRVAEVQQLFSDTLLRWPTDSEVAR